MLEIAEAKITTCHARPGQEVELVSGIKLHKKRSVVATVHDILEPESRIKTKETVASSVNYCSNTPRTAVIPFHHPRPQRQPFSA